jgi:Cu+-exporting ATPase
MNEQTNFCYHCHDDLPNQPIIFDQKQFCCNGCQQVYALLSQHHLGEYYEQDKQAGIRPNKINSSSFEMLDEPSIRSKYIDFEEGNTVKITLHLPQIHCASCIFLLEHLHKIHSGIVNSTVHFPKRLASITVNLDRIKLSELAVLLTKIGYEPNFSSVDKQPGTFDKRLLLQLGIAGFAFGSIMLWSFPEYLGIDSTYSGIRQLSSYLSFAVSIPVLLFSAKDYFTSALGGIRARSLNLDIPIAIGILALYFRSAYAIFNNEGPGYMDSFAAFVFFLLIGKWFQGKTYQWLSFERDYKAYFPVAVLRKTKTSTHLCPIENLEINDEITIRNEEIIPCDSILLSDKATIDYSFVSGEADWIEKKRGDLIYAGGKVCGETVSLNVLKPTSRSALTQIWNNHGSNNNELQFQTRQDRISRYFIAGVIAISVISGISWAFIDPIQIPEIITSVLIVACPCALALSVPFTYGNIMRKLGRKGFYLRNTTVIEKLQQCDTIVFDKTGTLTEQDTKQIRYEGQELSAEDYSALFAMTKFALHPYALAIYNQFYDTKFEIGDTQQAIELAGQGIQWNGYKLGSASFTHSQNEANQSESCSYLTKNDELIGKFIFESRFRNGLNEFIQSLQSHYRLAVVSGDKSRDLMHLRPIFPENTEFLFDQKPIDKKHYIENLQQQGHRVLMIGDGLNDAGALQSAQVGIALTEDLVRFTPASDAILKASHLRYLAEYLTYINQGKSYLKASFLFSISYNITGIGFAVSGALTPFVATVLMPLSSITVVGLATILTLSKKLRPTRDV